MRLGPTRFFTLTSPGTDSPDASYEQFQVRWHRFLAHLSRRWGAIEYLGVVERQKRGTAHIHVIYRGRFIPYQWLGRAAADAGFGKIADIRKPPSTIATYLVKYLTKELADPAIGPPRYFRRVRVSRGWSDWVRPKPKRRWDSWWIADAVPEHAALSAQRRGYLVVEGSSDNPEAWFHPGRVVRWLRPEMLREPGAFRPHAHPVSLGVLAE